MDESTPRRLPERTGRHLCTRCLAEVAADDYFANDHLCAECAADGDYPLKSTPEDKKKPKANNERSP